MVVQEVAVWSNPTVSIIWVVLSQILLYYLCNWTVSLVSTGSYILLSLYVYMTWVYTVWPAVRVPPSPEADPETWTPLHPDVLSAPELQTFLNNFRSRVSEVCCRSLSHLTSPSRVVDLARTDIITGGAAREVLCCHVNSFPHYSGSRSQVLHALPPPQLSPAGPRPPRGSHQT